MGGMNTVACGMTHAAKGLVPTARVNYRRLTALAALWAWLVAVIFPGLVWGIGPRWSLGLFFPLVVLLGFAQRGIRGRRLILLGVAPSALSLAVFFRSELIATDAWDASVRTVIAIAAGAYLLTAAAYCEQRPERPAEGERLPTSALTPVEQRRMIVQRVFLGLIALSSLGLLTLAPRYGARSESAELLLSTVAGLVIALGVLVSHFGPTLRANHKKDVPADDGHWLLLSFAVVAFWAFIVLHYLDVR